MHAHALLLLVLTLGGCAISGSVPDWVSDDTAGPEPTNYRFIIANVLDSIVGGKFLQTRFLEISSPRRVDVAKGATWLVCVKALRYPSREVRAYYAVFIQRSKIIDSRISVAIDQCDSQSYTPFEWSVDMNNPNF